MNRLLLVIAALTISYTIQAQQEVQLAVEQASSTTKPAQEQILTDAKTGNRTVYNVGNQTLTLYKPQGIKPNGVGVLICPGGAFHILDIDNEGVRFAQLLVAQGYTAAVLKYRLVPLDQKDPFTKMQQYASNFDSLEKRMLPVVPLAIEDVKTAMKYLQKNAASLGIVPTKIGVVGFSAGGTLAAAITFDSSSSIRPLFSAPVYPYLSPVLGQTVPANACPIFMAVAQNDDFGFDINCLAMYQKWKAAKAVVELHIYSKGKHGFGTKKQGLPVDSWIRRFTDWLKEMKFN